MAILFVDESLFLISFVVYDGTVVLDSSSLFLDGSWSTDMSLYSISG